MDKALIIKKIRDHYRFRSDSEFARHLGIKPQVLSNWKKRNTYDAALLYTKCLSISPAWLLTGEGPMLREGVESAPERALAKPEHQDSGVIVETVDTSGNKLIPVTNLSAAAGFGLYNNEYAEATDFISVPGRFLKSGRHASIHVKGTSMAPTFHDGSLQIIRISDRAEWQDLERDFIGVIVDKEGKGYFKRIKNRLREQGYLSLISDNPDKNTYPNFRLEAEEIQTICQWEIGLQFKAPDANPQLIGKVSELEEGLNELREQLKLRSKRR